MLMPGNGTAWFDDLKIELNGDPFIDTGLFDLGFESASPRGFFTGGNGYRVTLDNTVAYSGRQSLRMTRVAAVDTAPPVDRTKFCDPHGHRLEGRGRSAAREGHAVGGAGSRVAGSV
jgi:hypothetical protein